MFFQQEEKMAKPPKVAEEPKRSITPEEVEKLVEHVIALDKKIPSEIDFNIDDQGPWSFSKMKSLKKCPFQYYLKYILKFKLPAHYQIQDDPLSANLGKAAHEILEFIVMGQSVENSYKAAKKNYVGGKILTEDEWVTGVDSLNFNITRFAERIENLGRRHPIKKSLTELRMGFTRDYKPAGFFSDNVDQRGY